MWHDNETDRDFLNFAGVAGTVAEIIVQANGRPISIGVSGRWGVGKSSMISLVRKELVERAAAVGGSSQVFVEFNAWLYQGYDDARAALMDVIASKLAEEAEKRKTGIDKTKDLLKRVDWLRAAKMTAGTAVSLAAGVPPVGLVGDLIGIVKNLTAGDVDQSLTADAVKVEKDASSTAVELLKAKAVKSPPKEIHELRESFEGALADMGVTLVVFIDDLDRCLPETTISTLEAIRLFLFLKNTAFVIAADTEMIKNAVRRHFEGVTDEDLIVSYFDKLIQVPIRVPQLGTQEVRAYIMLLFVENSTIACDEKERIRLRVCEQLRLSWQGRRVDRAFLQSLAQLPDDLLARLETADRIAPLMTRATGISGNPRLIKRFLNALSIRMAISRAQGVGVDEAALAKMLLFERCGNAKAYAALAKAVSEDNQGRPSFLETWEADAAAGKALNLSEPWNDLFLEEWISLPPTLSDHDLRGILYVSREHAPLIMLEDRLSSEGAELLTALVENPEMARNLKSRLAAISRIENSIIMDRLIERAGKEQEWGVPSILEAMIVVAEVDVAQGARVAAFLSERPNNQIRPSIVPKISDRPWSRAIFDKWSEAAGISQTVKRAIKAN